MRSRTRHGAAPRAGGGAGGALPAEGELLQAACSGGGGHQVWERQQRQGSRGPGPRADTAARAHEDQSPNEVGLLPCQLLGDHAPEGEAQDVHLGQSQLAHDPRGQGCVGRHGQVTPGRLAVAAAGGVEGDRAQPCRQTAPQGLPHGPPTPQAVEQEEGGVLAANLHREPLSLREHRSAPTVLGATWIRRALTRPRVGHVAPSRCESDE